MNYLWDWEWEFAVMQALMEASMRGDLPPGTKVWDSVNVVQDRARQIYKSRKQKESKRES